jgi:Tfp pilus assembly protein PilE
MAESSESKRLLKTAVIVAVVGVVVLASLVLLFFRMRHDYVQQKIMNSNEADAIYALEQIAAAEQLYFQTNGQYATLQQLVESGVLQTTFTGDPPAWHGYKYALRVTPKTGAQSSTYSVNADPEIATGRDATGRRHFYISSEVVGLRYNEDRPAGPTDKPRQSVPEY